MVGNEDKGIFLFCQPYFLYICIRKSYPNKQSDAGHGNWNGCQLITRKWGNSSNSLDFKEVYFSYRFTEKLSFSCRRLKGMLLLAAKRQLNRRIFSFSIL